MALPATIDPTDPAGTASPSQGDDQLRTIKSWFVDVFGSPNNSAITAAVSSFTTAGVFTFSQSPLNVPTQVQGNASSILRIHSRYSQIMFEVNSASVVAITATGIAMQARHIESASGVTMVVGTQGGQSLVFRTNTLDRWAVDSSGMLVAIPTGLQIRSSGSVYSTAGDGSATYMTAGRLHMNSTLNSTSAATRTYLAYYTLPANTLSVNGQTLRVSVGGFHVDGNGTAIGHLGVDFGGSSLMILSSQVNAATLLVGGAVNIVRVGATSQKVGGTVHGHGGRTIGETLTGIITLGLWGSQSPSASMLVSSDYWLVENLG